MSRGSTQWVKWCGIGWIGLQTIALVPSLGVAQAFGEERSLADLQTSALTLKAIQASKNTVSADLKALLLGQPLAGVVTSRTPSPIRLSLPSLWWISAQLAELQQNGNQVIQDWIAAPGQFGQPGQIDLLVNRQQWSMMDYLQRYELVRKFSTIARSYGFNTRVYDSPDRYPVAFYICDFSSGTATMLQSPQLQRAPVDSQMGIALREQSNSLTCNLDIVSSRSLRRQPEPLPPLDSDKKLGN